MNENMKIWDSVKTPIEGSTKKITFGAKLTAIDNHYNIQRATALWGMCGKGWGYEVEDEFLTANNRLLYIAKVSLWYGTKETKIGHITCINEVIDEKGRLDDDAPKKAITDALSKLFSHLGFNADVYMGLFDGNKYIRNKNSSNSKTPIKEATTAPQTNSYKTQETVLQEDKSLISEKQQKYLFVIASQNNVDQESVKNIIKAYGYGLTKNIKKDDFSVILDAVKNKNQNNSQIEELDDDLPF